MSDPAPARPSGAVRRFGAGERPGRARGSRPNGAALAVGFVVIAVFGVAVVAYFVRLLPPGVVVEASILAVVPLVIVLIGIRLVDRWEPEPPVALVFAFFWGAAVSVGAALFVSYLADGLPDALGLSPAVAANLGYVVQAPIVEETAKGFGVLLVLWLFRRHFDGPVDGIVYAATVAAGFAFVENIQYFSVQVIHAAFGWGDIGSVFVVRGLLAPFGHIIYTAATGFFLGLAARRTGPLGAIGWFLLGLVPAVLLHALWNGALLVVGDSFLLYYVLVQVPIFGASVVLVVVLRRQERRVTRERLADYAVEGWFSPEELRMLGSTRGRRLALRWARSTGVARPMRSFIGEATRLASTRQRILTTRVGLDAALADEADLLVRVTESRTAMLAQPVPLAEAPLPPLARSAPHAVVPTRTYDAYGAQSWDDPDAT